MPAPNTGPHSISFVPWSESHQPPLIITPQWTRTGRTIHQRKVSNRVVSSISGPRAASRGPRVPLLVVFFFSLIFQLRGGHPVFGIPGMCSVVPCMLRFPCVMFICVASYGFLPVRSEVSLGSDRSTKAMRRFGMC